jgi:mono/diheme cytochrome c family protein
VYAVPPVELQVRGGRGMRLVRGGVGVCALVVVGLYGVSPAHAPRAQTFRTVQDGVYSEAQAARGQALYRVQCAECHGESLSGGSAPPLLVGTFVSDWRSQPLSALVNKVRHTMPPGNPGQLTVQQATDLVAHILNVGRLPPGLSDLPADEAAWAGISWPSASPAAQTAARPATAAAVEFPPTSNMAQLMRSIYFTNSNLIFTVQTRDPGEPVTPAVSDAPSAAGFSFVDWGAGIYTGWQLVDNAALALADVSPLMMTPGRRCENGRPVPVGDSEWLKYTQEMYEAALLVYKASQSRSQEAVSDATGPLSDACSNCHRAYRDRRPPGRGRGAPPTPGNPALNAGRCVSIQ